MQPLEGVPLLFEKGHATDDDVQQGRVAWDREGNNLADKFAGDSTLLLSNVIPKLAQACLQT